MVAAFDGADFVELTTSLLITHPREPGPG
jgi:hypothetical protein